MPEVTLTAPVPFEQYQHTGNEGLITPPPWDRPNLLAWHTSHVLLQVAALGLEPSLSAHGTDQTTRPPLPLERPAGASPPCKSGAEISQPHGDA